MERSQLIPAEFGGKGERELVPAEVEGKVVERRQLFPVEVEGVAEGFPGEVDEGSQGLRGVPAETEEKLTTRGVFAEVEERQAEVSSTKVVLAGDEQVGVAEGLQLVYLFNMHSISFPLNRSAQLTMFSRSCC